MRNHIKKLTVTCVAMLVLGAGATACASGAPGVPGEGAAPVGSAAPAESGPGSAPPELTLLMSLYHPEQQDPRGFYEAVCPQVTTCQNLVFYDFETLEQRYLCDVSGCAHDRPGCTSYLDTTAGVYACTYGDNLFLSYISYNESTGGGNAGLSALEKRNLDGTDPQLMITYPYGEFQADTIFTDGEWLYYIDKSGFVRLNIETYEKQLVAEVPQTTSGKDEHGFDIAASYTELVESSYHGQFLWRRLNPDGTRDLLLMNPSTGETAVAYSWPASENPRNSYRELPFTYTPEGKGYYVDVETGEIRCIDIAAGEDTLVTDMYAPQNKVYTMDMTDAENKPYEETHYTAESINLNGPFDGWLIFSYVVNPDPETGWGDLTMTAVNVDTGELGGEIPFQFYSNASSKPLMIWGHSSAGLLVTEEARSRPMHDIGTGGEPYVFDTEYFVYALIDVDDFVNAAPNFRTIAPNVVEAA